MGNGVTVQITGIDNLVKALEKARLEAEVVIKRRLASAGLELETEAKHNITDIPAVDTGKTRASVHYKSEDGGWTAAVHVPGIVPYVIEYGSAPHFPPIAPLEAWAQRHGLPRGMGFVIARNIAQRGTPAHPFMVPAFVTVSKRFVRDLEGDLKQMLESIKA